MKATKITIRLKLNGSRYEDYTERGIICTRFVQNYFKKVPTWLNVYISDKPFKDSKPVFLTRRYDGMLYGLNKEACIFELFDRLKYILHHNFVIKPYEITALHFRLTRGRISRNITPTPR